MAGVKIINEIVHVLFSYPACSNTRWASGTLPAHLEFTKLTAEEAHSRTQVVSVPKGFPRMELARFLGLGLYYLQLNKTENLIAWSHKPHFRGSVVAGGSHVAQGSREMF